MVVGGAGQWAARRQPDAADPAHFTFDVAVNGQRTTVDGHVANGGAVTLAPRAGPQPVAGTWEPPGSTWGISSSAGAGVRKPGLILD